jgi:hypothetical protein
MFEAINALVKAILDLTFFGDGLAAVLGFIGIFVAIVLMWSWTQYLVTETVLDFREWRQKRKAMKDAQGYP